MIAVKDMDVINAGDQVLYPRCQTVLHDSSRVERAIGTPSKWPGTGRPGDAAEVFRIHVSKSKGSHQQRIYRNDCRPAAAAAQGSQDNYLVGMK